MCFKKCPYREQQNEEDIKNRLVIAEENTLTIVMSTKQNYFRVLDMLEERGREFFIVER